MKNKMRIRVMFSRSNPLNFVKRKKNSMYIVQIDVREKKISTDFS